MEESTRTTQSCISFNYMDSFGGHTYLDVTLDEDTIDELVYAFKRFLYSATFSKELVDTYCQCEFD